MKLMLSAGSASAIGAMSYPSTGTILMALATAALIVWNYRRHRRQKRRAYPAGRIYVPGKGHVRH